jgi:mannose-6-phosphate isomerase-like protein (cupin superfamily)
VGGAARRLGETALRGRAAARDLQPGDWVFIAAGRKHRVEQTDIAIPSVWLAVHVPPA